MNDTASYSVASLSRGSLSFSMASRFFPAPTRADVAKLYAWCRYADDLVDEEDDTPEMVRRERLQKLTLQSLSNQGEASLAVRAFREVRTNRKISHRHILEFLAGMRMDCRNVRVEDEHELNLYCHRVAGVVGQMMCRVIGVDDNDAPRHADDLGKAMQITNICRDVAEDFRRGRVYIPRTLLTKHGLHDETTLMASGSRLALLACVHELLHQAERLYKSGDRGLIYLPLRAAIAVGAAREIYRAIGREVLRRGPRAWDERVWIPGWKKALLACKGLVRALETVPLRVLRAGEPVLQG